MNEISRNLEERTVKFAEEIISFVKKVPRDVVANPIISQLVRAGTSIGANYCEANDAESKKDFTHKIGICKKEARESMYWLRVSVSLDLTIAPAARALWQEAKELNLIFSKIIHTSKNSALIRNSEVNKSELT